tara:strand:- start:28 stop:1440 length:1413 start_codon:yes stop_codon:yes gene_type:complete
MATKFEQNMEVTGRVTAVQFEGDGSLLTGITSQNFAGDITRVNITAGNGLTGSQDTSSGEHTQTLAVDSGLGANQIVQLNGDGRLPAIDGSLLTNLPGGGGGGSSLNIQDEGTALSTAATTLNFVGAGVTASGTGATKTITINGGSGSGYSDSDVDLHLNQSGPTPGYVLTWNGSDYAWTANGTGSGLGDMVDDTTPQLGGNLDLNGNDIVTGANRVTFADSGVCSFMDFTVTHFGQNNNTVLSSVKSINMFLDSNGGDSGQAFRIYNNIDPDTATTESDYIFKVEEDGDVVIKGTFRSEQAGAPIMTSASSLTLQATTRTSIANTPLQLESFTTSARDALTTADGDMIYNSQTSKFQGYANGSWVDLAATTGPLTYSVQNLTGPGAISLTETVTLITTTGTDAYTLADGNLGQLKVICMVGNGGDGTLTPNNLVGWTSVKFSGINNSITMIYTNIGWHILALQQATRIS